MAAFTRINYLLRRGVLTLAASAVCFPALAEPDFVRNGTAGFVVSNIAFALAEDSEKTGACPLGLNRNAREIAMSMRDGQQRKGESDQEYEARLSAGARNYSVGEDGLSICMMPKAGAIDPDFRTVQTSSVPVEGFDLDGLDTRADTAAASGMCQHQDFVGIDGTRGVDNQFFRAVGCVRGYQSLGQANTFNTGMLTGSWGVVLTVKGIDDIRNDDDVEVGISANADPIQLSADRNPLPYATYAMTQDPRFRGTARGRIKDGVLTSDPMNVRFYSDRNSIIVDRSLQRARVRATIAEDGTLTGYIGGYAQLEELWDLLYGMRNGRDSAGQQMPPRRISGTVSGASSSHGVSCPAMYDALYKLADADRDPQTGQCNSISMQYRISAVPAFVVDIPTESANAELAKKPQYDRAR